GPAHVYVLVHAGARAGARGRGGATAAGGRGRLGEPARRPGGAAHRSRSSGTRGVVAPARCRGAPRRGGGDRADRSRAGTAPRLAVPDRGGRPAVRATTGAVVGGPVRGRRQRRGGGRNAVRQIHRAVHAAPVRGRHDGPRPARGVRRRP